VLVLLIQWNKQRISSQEKKWLLHDQFLPNKLKFHQEVDLYKTTQKERMLLDQPRPNQDYKFLQEVVNRSKLAQIILVSYVQWMKQRLLELKSYLKMINQCRYKILLIIHKYQQWLVTKHKMNYHNELLKSVSKLNENNKIYKTKCF